MQATWRNKWIEIVKRKSIILGQIEGLKEDHRQAEDCIREKVAEIKFNYFYSSYKSINKDKIYI